MHVWWFISIIIYLLRPSYTWWWAKKSPYPWLERYHYPGAYTTIPTPYVNGTSTRIANPDDTPDWRVEEPHFVIFKETFVKEMERPYRNSPPTKQSLKAGNEYWRITERQMGCYCNTVYRKYILLAGCAVITTRHVLTTATTTILILRSYGHLKSLDGILGGWYDTDVHSFNSSLYFTPSRIHIHPMYRYDYEVNVSHPIPCMFDLSVWAGTHAFYGTSSSIAKTIVCPRAASSWSWYTTTIPRYYDVSIVAGFMFMKSYKRRPMPWFRYVVKTRNHVWPCPKSDWQWFHCVLGEYWGRYGFDSGGGMNTAYQGGWRNDGMAGLCAFSLKLRAMQLAHYFTVVDCYPVLDFLYDAFMGLQKYVYLDDRFEDTKWAAPIPWWGEYIWNGYIWGEQFYYNAGNVPKYRR